MSELQRRADMKKVHFYLGDMKTACSRHCHPESPRESLICADEILNVTCVSCLKSIKARVEKAKQELTQMWLMAQTKLRLLGEVREG